ncbi:hypothetical protein [Oceanibaculum nanhaiense]|uniref:hypothetical protein n=1 Tax=Oceanibaculum nanhaiense TaxID=1909734 RepID=UPI003D2D3166
MAGCSSTRPGVTYIAREVGLHKQAAFSREKVLATAINACTTAQEAGRRRHHHWLAE